nr:winged helix-turn-helix domain-containing protein [Flavobacterium sp. LC2016-01]
MPVKKIAENEYLIRFENDFTFQPDSLVNTTSRFLDKQSFASNYIVNVLNCSNSSVAYGYAISKNKKDNIVACLGRKQPKACYMIKIKFEPTSINIVKNLYLLGSLSFLGFFGFIFLRSFKPQKALSYSEHKNEIALGSAIFDAMNKKLFVNGKAVDLTGTETRLLLIFALSPNEIIEKKRIQKEIWEDEGVIVGRSLDMFISKLRKKLEFDPNIKIVVVRGKGYKLEIGSLN